jgi:hypothetical protein
MQEPGTRGNYTYILLDYQISRQITKGFSQLQSGKNYTLYFRDSKVHDVSNPVGGTLTTSPPLGLV